MIRLFRVIPALPVLLLAVSAWADEPAAPDPATVLRAALPHDLSPWSMFLSADSIVKAVMIGLAIASVVTWTVWLAKAIELFALKRRLRRALEMLDAIGSLADAARVPEIEGPGADLIRAAITEMGHDREASPEGVKERVGSRLERIEAGVGRAMSRGTGILATIGATAPFVGLFGTVWGIMNSFIGISKVQTTNLAVVAPGIAEALLATAIGLVAAIPATAAYNKFATEIGRYGARLDNFANDFVATLSRNLEGSKTERPERGEREAGEVGWVRR